MDSIEHGVVRRRHRHFADWLLSHAHLGRRKKIPAAAAPSGYRVYAERLLRH